MIDGRNKSATCARKVPDYFFLIGELKKIVGNYFGGGPQTRLHRPSQALLLRTLLCRCHLTRLQTLRRQSDAFHFPGGMPSHARIRAPPFISKKEDILFLVLSRACTRPFFL